MADEVPQLISGKDTIESVTSSGDYFRYNNCETDYRLRDESVNQFDKILVGGFNG